MLELFTANPVRASNWQTVCSNFFTLQHSTFIKASLYLGDISMKKWHADATVAWQNQHLHTVNFNQSSDRTGSDCTTFTVWSSELQHHAVWQAITNILEELAFSTFHPEHVGSRCLQKLITTYETTWLHSSIRHLNFHCGKFIYYSRPTYTPSAVGRGCTIIT